jgi:lipopolysaccharide/colanic/teichoic acid biosynthesis glycosyltransferase
MNEVATSRNQADRSASRPSPILLPPRQGWTERSIRLLDIAASVCGLVLLAPLFLLVACAIRFDSPGPVFFCQTRMGRYFRPFRMYKFRTMVQDASSIGGELTVGHDRRITAVGRALRKTRIDELPQLINVLIGEMSLVGPRPEVEQFVERFREDYQMLLSVRPGITDPASVAFRNEAAMLAEHEDHEQYYVTVILPEKIRLSKQYIAQRSVLRNLSLIGHTLCAVCRPMTRDETHTFSTQGSNHVPKP